MAHEDQVSVIGLTAEIVAAHVGHNSVHASDLPKLISSIHEALAGLGSVSGETPAPTEYKPAVSARKSLASDDHIISMIDGKPYKTLRRHLAGHGLTDKDYRARYNLPDDYPMVSKTYSAARAAMARTIGLGRKAGQKIGEATAAVETKAEEVVAPVVAKAKRGAKRAVGGVENAVPATRPGRKPKAEATA